MCRHGIGVACCLAAMDDPRLTCGPLEALLTVDEKYGAEARQHSRLPGWTARPNSPFSELVQMRYRSALGKPVTLKAYHAGMGELRRTRRKG